MLQYEKEALRFQKVAPTEPWLEIDVPGRCITMSEAVGAMEIKG